MKKKIFIFFILIMFIGINLKGNQSYTIELKKKIPDYLKNLKKIAQDTNNNNETFEELINGASSASMLFQLVNKKSEKVKILSLGYTIADKLMKKYPQKSEGYHYGAFLLGMIGVYKGPHFILNYLPKIEKMALKGLKLNPNFHHGSTYVTLCATYFESPGFPLSIGNIYKAKKYCQFSIKNFPDNCTAYLYLASIYDTLKLKDNALETLKIGEKNCAPVDNSLEEKVWYEEDYSALHQMINKLIKGESIRHFMQER